MSTACIEEAISQRSGIMAAESLANELATYEWHKDELVRPHEGKFVLIHGEDIAGIWDTYQDALAAGYKQFGLEPFLVKQVLGVVSESSSSPATFYSPMPIPTLPLEIGGAIIDVGFAVSGPRQEAMRKAGLEVPPPVLAACWWIPPRVAHAWT